MPLNSLKWLSAASLGEAKLLLSFVFFIDFSCDDFDVVVEAEDGADEQEGLGDIDQQAVRHVVDHDDLIRNQCNATHDEQHRTGILRDFKAHLFHSFLLSSQPRITRIFTDYFSECRLFVRLVRFVFVFLLVADH